VVQAMEGRVQFRRESFALRLERANVFVRIAKKKGKRKKEKRKKRTSGNAMLSEEHLQLFSMRVRESQQRIWRESESDSYFNCGLNSSKEKMFFIAS
jgi:hypothetical protein